MLGFNVRFRRFKIRRFAWGGVADSDDVAARLGVRILSGKTERLDRFSIGCGAISVRPDHVRPTNSRVAEAGAV